jgi:hypothetical protein
MPSSSLSPEERIRAEVTKSETVGFLGKPFKQECFINYLAKALIGCKYKGTER